VGAALVGDHLDSSVKSSEDVEALLHIPTLAIIPSFSRDRE
jgi:capsular polysaccharide biosynthesis protein